MDLRILTNDAFCDHLLARTLYDGGSAASWECEAAGRIRMCERTIADLRASLIEARQRERERCADVARRFAARYGWYYDAAVADEIMREE